MGWFSRKPAAASAPSARAMALGAEVARVRGSNAHVPRGALRRFEGGVVDRLTASWLAIGTAIDQELRGQLAALVARSRDLFKNNSYAAKFARMVRNNIVGPEGFTLQCRVVDANGKADTLANKVIEAAFWRFMRPENCDVTGKRGFADLLRGIVTTLARDGEYLVRKVRGSGAGEFGYQLQVMDPTRLDVTLNREASGSQNAIVMGVEMNAYRKPVAYHILISKSSSGHYSRERERVPADEMFHGFIPLEDEQTRGVPWLHAAMRLLNDLGGYREAAVIAARVGASKMGIWETPDGQPPPGYEEKDDDGNYITDAAPGTFDYAPAGYKLAKFDPAYPHDQFDAFCKAALRGIASGAGVSYHGLANDLEGVTFSSIRSGVLEEREEWMALQNWLTTVLLIPVFEDWLAAALMKGAVKLPNGSILPAAKLDKFLAHIWQGRRWAWVDPLKDIQAAALAIGNRLASPQQIAAQSGRDVEDILDDIAAFEAMAATKKVSLPVGGATTKKPSAVGSESKEQDEEEEED